MVFGVFLATGILITATLAESDTEYLVGSEDDDWWITYPDQHPNAGFEVDHPQWIIDALVDQPIIILDHSSGGCKACVYQESYVDAVLEDYDKDIAYYNMIAGVGEFEAEELFDIYDPDGGASYVPLTIVLTLVQDPEDEIVVGWHSVEDDKGGEDLVRYYVEDAIMYYEDNRDDWDY